MNIIPGEKALRQCIPNTLVTVEGEPTLFEKIYHFLEAAELWLVENILSETVIQSLKDRPENEPIKMLAAKIIAAHALMAAIPSLDLVLTPNGFGIVNTSNIAPASKDRVERLMAAMEAERDNAIELLLPKLKSEVGWLETRQARFFARTLFPNISLCRRLAIRQRLWDEYHRLQAKLVKIENVLAETYFSQKQMDVFREKVIKQEGCHRLMEQVIRSIQSLELLLISDMQVHNQSFYDIVNLIRANEDVFPEWHASDTAKLYIPCVYENKKESSGYWF